MPERLPLDITRSQGANAELPEIHLLPGQLVSDLSYHWSSTAYPPFFFSPPEFSEARI